MIFLPIEKTSSRIAWIWNTILVGSLFLFNPQLQAQNKFAKSAIIGTSYTYIGDPETDILGTRTWFHEFIWNSNVALEVWDRWYLGLSYLHITSNSTRIGGIRMRNDIYSIFSAYQLLEAKRWNGYVEAGYMYGDYCVCGLGDPYQQDGLHYLSLTFSLERQLYKRLYLDIGMHFNHILNQEEPKGGFNHYILGLNYRLGKGFIE